MNAIVENQKCPQTCAATSQHLRVGLVISSLGAGGAERVASILAGAWSKQGVEVTVLTFYPPGTDFHRVGGGIRRLVIGFVLDSEGWFRRMVFHVKRAIRLRRVLRELCPDVLVSFGHASNLLVLICTRALGVPVIVSERTDPRLAPSTWRTRWLRTWLYRYAGGVVVQSDAVRDWARQSLPEKTIRVIPNPVTLPNVDSLRRRAKRIIGLGRLAPEKGFDLLIAAFARCATVHPEWTLAIFGEGPERQALQQLAENLGVREKVSLEGLTREPMAELSASEIFVLSSRFEGFPNALLEAMSCGLAVVSFDCPSGPAEIISHRVDGIIVPPGNVDLLSASLSELMSDKALRSELGSSARAVVERYHVDKISRAWCDLFAELVSYHQSKRGESPIGTGVPE